MLSNDGLAVILTNDIIELSENVKRKGKCEDSNDSGNEGDNKGEEAEEEEVKKESNGRAKKGRWVSRTPFFFFPFVNFYSCLPLF